MSLPKPEGMQREVLCLPERGHAVILGCAGSGKTTLAILRAYYLAENFCDKNEKVLLVTFNKALVSFLKGLDNKKENKVVIEHFHKVAMGYLNSRGLMKQWGAIVPTNSYGTNVKLDMIEEALEVCKRKEGNNAVYNKHIEFYYDEISWIQKMGIQNSDVYEKMERVGRAGTKVNRINRKNIYQVYTEYLVIRKDKGYMYDWDDIATYMKEELDKDKSNRRYRHIIVDEGQDFSPEMLRALVRLVSNNGSLSFFGDIAQQIYGSRLSWRNADISVSKVWKFEYNYRNSKEIRDLAVAITKMQYFEERGDKDLILPVAPKASGPKPAIIHVKSKEEIKYVVDLAKREMKTSKVAILVRTRELVRKIQRFMHDINDYQVLRGEMGYWNENINLSIGTYHAAKGLEFDTVIMPFCNTEVIPDESNLRAFDDRDDALAEEIKLIYVTVTRARRGLILTYSGTRSELIPENKNGIYQEFEV